MHGAREHAWDFLFFFAMHYIEKFTSIPCDKPLKMYYTNSGKRWLVFYDVVVSTNHMYIK
jgi:hypothetical protein